jgi:hypothetical protein
MLTVDGTNRRRFIPLRANIEFGDALPMSSDHPSVGPFPDRCLHANPRLHEAKVASKLSAKLSPFPSEFLRMGR